MDCLNALKAFVTAFHKYLEKNGRRTYEIASLTGQKRIKIHLRALWRFHNPLCGYRYIEEALNAILECSDDWLKELGIKIGNDSGNTYIDIPLQLLKTMLDLEPEKMLDLLIQAGACRKELETKE